MDREAIEKEIDRILDSYGISSDREPLKKEILNVVESAYSEGWSDGYDEVAEEQSIPYPGQD